MLSKKYYFGRTRSHGHIWKTRPQSTYSWKSTNKQFCANLIVWSINIRPYSCERMRELPFGSNAHTEWNAKQRLDKWRSFRWKLNVFEELTTYDCKYSTQSCHKQFVNTVAFEQTFYKLYTLWLLWCCFLFDTAYFDSHKNIGVDMPCMRNRSASAPEWYLVYNNCEWV